MSLIVSRCFNFRPYTTKWRSLTVNRCAFLLSISVLCAVSPIEAGLNIKCQRSAY
jgi:hypothetical protein